MTSPLPENGEWYCASCDAYRPLSACVAQYPIVYCPRCNDALGWEPAPGQDEATSREEAVGSLRQFWFGEEGTETP